MLIATLIASVGILARPLFEGIAECITTCFGSATDSVVEAIEEALEGGLVEGGSGTEGDSETEITSNDVDWNVGDNLKHHVANGSNGSHREPWKKFGFDPDDPNFYSQVLPFLKRAVDEGSKYKVDIVPKGTVSYYIKNFADRGYEIIVKIFTHPNGEKVLSDAYINMR